MLCMIECTQNTSTMKQFPEPSTLQRVAGVQKKVNVTESSLTSTTRAIQTTDLINWVKPDGDQVGSGKTQKTSAPNSAVRYSVTSHNNEPKQGCVIVVAHPQRMFARSRSARPSSLHDSRCSKRSRNVSVSATCTSTWQLSWDPLVVKRVNAQ